MVACGVEACGGGGCRQKAGGRELIRRPLTWTRMPNALRTSSMGNEDCRKDCSTAPIVGWRSAGHGPAVRPTARRPSTTGSRERICSVVIAERPASRAAAHAPSTAVRSSASSYLLNSAPDTAHSAVERLRAEGRVALAGLRAAALLGGVDFVLLARESEEDLEAAPGRAWKRMDGHRRAWKAHGRSRGST